MTSNSPVFTSGCSSTSNNPDNIPMARNKNPFSLIQPGLVRFFIKNARFPLSWNVNFFSATASVAVLATCALGLLVAALTTGCQSPPKHRVAAVTIENASSEQIKTAAQEVFEQHSYEYAPEDENDLVFQKKGSFMNSFVYGDWYQGAVWLRVKLFLTEQKLDRTLLDCDVFMVQEPEDPFFQKERRVKAAKSECKKLLNEIADKLQRKAKGSP